MLVWFCIRVDVPELDVDVIRRAIEECLGLEVVEVEED